MENCSCMSKYSSILKNPGKCSGKKNVCEIILSQETFEGIKDFPQNSSEMSKMSRMTKRVCVTKRSPYKGEILFPQNHQGCLKRPK